MMDTAKHPNGSTPINRREFLKLSATGMMAALGFGLPVQRNLFAYLNQISNYYLKRNLPIGPFNQVEIINPDQQGRMLNQSVNIFDLPSFSARRVNTYFRDWVVPITDITIGSSEDSFNLVWFKIGNEGYAHSGGIQPVLTKTNPVITNIAPGGAVAEVTVPFTDARWDPDDSQSVAYRFYYATNYWIVESVADQQGNSWYGVLDDKWEYIYYVTASHLRIIPAEELTPLSANIPPQNKRIEVHIPEQVLIAYEYDNPVFMARIASGAVFSNGDFSTPLGRFMTYHKQFSRHMARGNLAANGYDLPGVPWNTYITEDGIAFHGTYWHNNFGRPRSHGCINLTPQAAKWIFLWTSPTVPADQAGIYEDTGTVVDVIG
jgi:lipoprotein-anchoring transpeptidase ErfK/SrfK